MEDAGYDLGDSTVAGDVAGGSEAIHGYVEGYHHGIVGVGKAEYRRQQAQLCHDCSPRDAGCGYDCDAEHGYEACKHAEIIGHAMKHHHG